MSFLDQLKDVGFGNRGPYGRMQSGASYLSDTIDKNLQVGAEKGFNKALIAATRGGKQVSPEQIIDISDKWGIPLQRVMDSAKKINEPIETRRLENLSKSIMIRTYGYREENPKGQPKIQEVMQWVKDAGGDPQADGAFVIATVQRMLAAEQGKVKAVGPGDALVNTIGGKATEIYKNIKPEGEKKDTRTTEIKNFEYGKNNPEFAELQKKRVGSKGPGDAKPEFYYENLQGGFKKINEGADPQEIFKMMRTEYPSEAKELLSIEKAYLAIAGLSPEAKEELQKSVEAVNAGNADKNKEASRLGSLYPQYATIINRILKPGATDQTLQAIAALFGN